jgi:[ribosomal protein S5]-alanine N-acetyltransferase
MILLGDRISLKPVSEADLELAEQMNQDVETMRFLGGVGVSRGYMNTFIHKQQTQFAEHDWGWMVIESQADKIGFVFLRYCSRLGEIELGYRLSRNFWGKGYATESAQLLLTHALTQLNLSPIVAAVDPLNAASERVLQKIGMQYWKQIGWESTPSGFARCYKAS